MKNLKNGPYTLVTDGSNDTGISQTIVTSAKHLFCVNIEQHLYIYIILTRHYRSAKDEPAYCPGLHGKQSCPPIFKHVHQQVGRHVGRKVRSSPK